MCKSLLSRILIALTLLVGAMSGVSAANRMYVDASFVLPGQTRTLALALENEVAYYGFQADISLPDGLTFVAEDETTPAVNLASRTDASYTLVSNRVNSELLRVGAFSSSHSPILGNDGALIYVNVAADSNFAGGELSLTNIHMVDETDSDVSLSDFKVNVRNQALNICYLPEFSIAVAETKTISLMLENETPFTAFQTDIYLPTGFSIREDSFKTTERTPNHTVSVKSFSDGRTRIICFSPANCLIEEGRGAVVEFDLRVDRDMDQACIIELKNQTFSTSNAEEYPLPDTKTDVSVSGALVSEIILSERSHEMFIGDTFTLVASVIPDNATYQEVEWISSNTEVATVSSIGVVTAISEGNATITAKSTDGTDVSANCEVMVKRQAINSCYLSDFSIAVAETKTIFVMLENETPFTAFQTDIYLPTGFSIREDSFKTTERTPNHTVSVNSLSDGSTRISCSSPANSLIEAGTGAVVEFDLHVDRDVDQECIIELKNQKFTTSNSEEYLLPDTKTNVSVFGALVSEIILSESSHEMLIGDTFTLVASVIPDNATYKGVEWFSNNPEVATVSSIGVVTAVSEGNATITAKSTDGSNVSANCEVTVKKDDSGTESITEDNFRITVKNNQVIIAELACGITARLYALNGIQLNTATGNGLDVIFDVATNACYILNIGKVSFKVSIR